MSIRTTAWITAALVVSIGGSGCFWVTTKHEGKKLRKSVATLDRRVGAQESALGSKVEELTDVLAKATKLLARNSADLGTEVDDLEQETARLAGLIAQANTLANEVKTAEERQRKLTGDRIDELERRLAALEEKINRVPAKSAAELFQQGKTALDTGDYGAAGDAFKSLVLKFPDNSLADDAQYYRGEAHYRQKSYQLALGELQKVFEKYPQSNWAPKALFRAGEAAIALKWCTDARAYLGLLRQKYPRSSLVSKSRKLDGELRKNAKNARKCQS